MELGKKKKFTKINPLLINNNNSTLEVHHRKRLAHGCTNLMYACQQGLSDSIVSELRYKPNIVHCRDRSNKTALHYCSGQRDLVAAASVAVAAPELLESADEDGFTPLHLAVIQGNMSLVNLLLANKADVGALDNEGHSVVHWATVCGEIEALRAVLQAGANVSNPDLNGGSPLHYAAQMCGANYEGKSNQASSKLALEILNILLSHRETSVDIADRDGRQPLLWAASAGSSKAILALVKAGGRVESADKDGLTALHCAASRGHNDCLDTLINLCGAPTDLIDSNGCTALHYAVTLGHADASSLLLKLDADPNRQDRKGRTPAHCGCAKGQFETVKILGGNHANLWLRNAKGDLPIHEAAASGRKELVLWLLEKRPNQINVTSNDGRTLLHIAASHENIDMCKMLLDLGADVNSVSRNPLNVIQTPLDCSLQKGHRSIAKYLQAIGGLPASKIRLSARRHTKQTTESVKPLKFTEKEEITDLKGNKSKRYVVYVKRSESEETTSGNLCDNKKNGSPTQHRSRKHDSKKHNHCKCRHYSGRRRRRATSTCSEKYKSHHYLGSETGEHMNRSKSNLEIKRHHKHRHCKHSSSSSSPSTSPSDNEYETCKIKYDKIQKKQRRSKSSEKYHSMVVVNDGKKYKKSRPKSSTSDDTEMENAKQKLSAYKEKMLSLEREKSNLVLVKSDNQDILKQDQVDRPSSSGSSSKKRPQSARASSAQRRRQLQQQATQDFEVLAEQSLTSEALKLLTDVVNYSTDGNESHQRIITEAQVHQSPLLPDHNDIVGQPNNKIPSDATFILDKMQTEIFEENKSITQKSIADTTTTTTTNIEQTENIQKSSSLDDADSVEIKKTNIESIAEENQQSENLFTATTTLSPQANKSDEFLSEKLVVTSTTEDTSKNIDEKEIEKLQKQQQDNKSFSLIENDKLFLNKEEQTISPTLLGSDNQPPPTLVTPQSTSIIPPSIIIEQKTAITNIDEIEKIDEKAKSSFTILEDEENIITKPTTIATSYQVLLDNNNDKEDDDDDDDDGGGGDKKQQKNTSKNRSSFTIIDDDVNSGTLRQQQHLTQKAVTATSNKDEQNDDDDYVDDDDEDEDDEQLDLIDSGGEHAIQRILEQPAYRIGSSRKKRLKKRIKNNNFSNTDDTNMTTSEQEAGIGRQMSSSKDQDSGFEPSPRAMKSKVQVSSLSRSKKHYAFQTLDDRPQLVRPRAEGRKPGDQSAVNMTTVSQSIQKNIRRYYMERKIFQHLLELKSLQIRSSKINEAQLVKRAVDDYHKSILALGLETGSTMKRYPNHEYTFKNFEIFLYETLKNLQKNGTYNFQNISEVYQEAERRLSSPEYNTRYERALHCTTKTHRCLHAAHAYTGIPCAAYIPMMNHHTIPKLGFGSYKTTGVGSFYLPKILTRNNTKAGSNKVSLELSHGNNKQLIPLPYEKLDKNKKYYVTFSVKGNNPNGSTNNSTNGNNNEGQNVGTTEESESK